jgi:hypothetical protein
MRQAPRGAFTERKHGADNVTVIAYTIAEVRLDRTAVQ